MSAAADCAPASASESAAGEGGAVEASEGRNLLVPLSDDCGPVPLWLASVDIGLRGARLREWGAELRESDNNTPIMALANDLPVSIANSRRVAL